uniref:Uncharacterized protein n=1 Tax=Eutreptiella gymnastica TaxID=73025 RepID=A0A7S1NN21_9EUGL
MTVHKGLAYVLQYVAPVDKYAENTDMVNNIAKTMLIDAFPHSTSFDAASKAEQHGSKATIHEALVSRDFVEYGVGLQLPPGWDAMVDEFSIAGPQIAVIRIHPPGCDQSIPGEVPTLSVIVEDVGREQMTLLEYKEKSKEYAMNMNGGGMTMMPPPQITKDDAVNVGNFQHTLEYTQTFPNAQAGGHMRYQFQNLMTLHKGLAYVLQYYARQDKFDDYVSAATAIAESLTITDLPPRPASRLEFNSQPHGLKVKVPETWSWLNENKDMGDGRMLVVSFVSGSSNKPDGIALYVVPQSACKTPQAMAERYQDIVKSSGEITSKEGGIAHFTYNADGKVVVVYCRDRYVVECRSEGERVTHHNQDDGVITSVLQSIETDSAKRSNCRYINTHSRFAFDLATSSKVLEHKWGTTSVTYVPVSDDEEQSVPIFTIEVNHEQEHYPDLQTLEARMMAGNDPNNPLKDKKIEKFGGRDFLSFEMQREEKLSIWGPSEEFRSKILLTLRGEESIMCKWEVAGRDWKRYERYLAAIMDSIEVFPEEKDVP